MPGDEFSASPETKWCPPNVATVGPASQFIPWINPRPRQRPGPLPAYLPPVPTCVCGWLASASLEWRLSRLALLWDLQLGPALLWERRPRPASFWERLVSPADYLPLKP